LCVCHIERLLACCGGSVDASESISSVVSGYSMRGAEGKDASREGQLLQSCMRCKCNAKPKGLFTLKNCWHTAKLERSNAMCFASNVKGHSVTKCIPKSTSWIIRTIAHLQVNSSWR